MFLSNVSVKRPIAMACLIIGLALLGLNSYRKIGLELMPKLDMPFITIATVYPGASPTEIETDIAKRIEDAVTSIDGLKHVTSSCMENVCLTSLEFNLDVDVDIAAMDVREKLDMIKADMPAGAEDPKIQKFDVNAAPIVTLALTGDVPLDELFDYADNALKDRISTIPGVAEISLIGGAEREVHVLLDREKLAAHGLTTTQVMQSVQQGIGVLPSGRLRDGGTEYGVKFDADVATIKDLGLLEVANVDGQRCLIQDVGRIIMGTEELRQQAIVDGKPGISIRVVKKSDANAVAVADKVKAKLAELQAELPGGMELIWITDDGTFIKATNDSAWINVLQGIVLTAVILFLFLYNLRSLIVVGITMPLTIVIGLFFMQMLDFTLNTSTLIAIGMSVGILVTNSIVVLEAIMKRLDETGIQKRPVLGAKESFIAVLASAGTNVVVLFPLAIMDSLVGTFFRPLALTMFIMTLVSLFISFTLTPMLCSILLKPRVENATGILPSMERGWNHGFNILVRWYGKMLGFCEKHRWAAILTILIIFGVFLHSMALAGKVGMGFFDDADKGEIYVKVEYPTSYSLDKTMERVTAVSESLKKLPEIKHSLTMVGKVQGMLGKSSEGVYLAQILLKFSERTERELTMDDLLALTREKMSGYPGALVTVSQPSLIGGENTPIQLEIYGTDLGKLDELALEMQDRMRQIPGILNPDTSVRMGKPELRIRPNREVLADTGLPAHGLAVTLRGNIEGLEAGTFKRDARNYDVVVKLEQEKGKEQVKNFQLPSPSGKPVSLETFGTIEETHSPVQITRQDKRRTTIVYGSHAASLPLGTAVNKITEAIADIQLPPGYDYRFSGTYEKMQEGNAGMGEAGLVAIILVVLTLAAIMESFKQPIFILVTIPLALTGTIWSLYLTGMSFGMFVIMGCVMMIGIVVNNAILIMDQMNVHIAEGFPRHGAMIGAAMERFRPIIMITIAAVLGMLPLALSKGIGAEIRNGVGIASVGGILVSGLLTLLVVPVLYDLFTRRGKIGRPAPHIDGESQK